MRRPNLLILMCDQLRVDALSAPAGSGAARLTPAIAGLARQATSFSACFTASPVCVPARISLATGLYPHNHGYWHNVPMRDGKALGSSDTTHALDPNWQTWMEAIRASGYRTCLIGKTHLHCHDGDLRQRQYLLHAYGYDDVDEIGGPRASLRVGSHLTERWQRLGLWETYREDYRRRFAQALPVAWPSPLPVEEQADVYVGRQAQRWLQDYRGEAPWLLVASFGGPHEPWDAPEPYASHFPPAQLPAARPRRDWMPCLPESCHLRRLCDTYDKKFKSASGLPAEQAALLRGNYAGSVALIDEQIALLLQTVAERGEMDSTIIVLCADHGEMNGDYGLITKGTFCDASLQVPLIIRTPQTAARGAQTATAPVELNDLGATLVELAGADWRAPHFACSLTGALADPLTRCRASVLSELEGECCLRVGDHSLWTLADGQPAVLLDHRRPDPEADNVLADPAYAEVLKDLERCLLRHLLRTQLHQPGPRTRIQDLPPRPQRQ